MYSQYELVPKFDYSSYFSYSSDPKSFEEWLNEAEQTSTKQHQQVSNVFQKLVYWFLVILSILFFVITIPFSSFFCIKKINSLQRCLTYRLGQRLPLKGPGFILKLPFIDQISLIDLNETHFKIMEANEQVMTSDGSIVSFIKPYMASLNVMNALLTSLKINRNVDVKRCLSLRFANLIRSQHVEDLENKIDFVIRSFEEKFNNFLKDWGYAIKFDQLPSIKVIDRADPINPIMKKFRNILNTQKEDDDSSDLNFFDLINKSINIESMKNQNYTTEDSFHIDSNDFLEKNDQMDKVIETLKFFINQYQSFLPKKSINIEIIVPCYLSPIYFNLSNGSLTPIIIQPEDSIGMTIEFKNQTDFEKFLLTKDLNYLTYRIH